MKINTEKLAAMLKAKRGKRGLRQTAQDIGAVSSSTLSRVEQGKLPDLETFIRLCEWLGVSQEDFVLSSDNEPTTKEKTSVPDEIEVHLRADRVLDQNTIEALLTMVRLAYDAAQRGTLKSDEEE